MDKRDKIGLDREGSVVMDLVMTLNRVWASYLRLLDTHPILTK